jgi:NAD(P)-dependent dehydrogenase (short-subunit alcohol dehydrogenase family)
MDLHLKDKVVIVTGAASGIGRATGKAFSAEGAKVVLADINEPAGLQVAREIREHGGDATFVRTDVGDSTQVRRMIQAAADTYGGLDILHNNAYWTEPATATETTEENWDRTIGVTLKGVWLGIKFGIPEMLKRGGGVVVNTASTQAIAGEPKFAAYQAAKGGVMALTRQVAVDYGPQIRINTVLPGAVETPGLHIGGLFNPETYLPALPLRRIGTPEEIASVVLFLASDLSAYMTGTGVIVDGGYTAV